MRRRILLSSILLVGLLVIAGAQAQTGPHIQGKGSQGSFIDVQGSQGTFSFNGQSWPIEFVFKWLGQDGFANLMWFLGRKSDDYLLLFAYVNTAGENFAVWYFDYKQATGSADAFSGDYSVGAMQAMPTALSGYLPEGKIPDYSGQEFRVDTPYAQLTPAGGKVSYEELQLVVYPVFDNVVSQQLSEFWMIGIDASTKHTYHLIFYTDRDQAWLVDLWRGQISLLPLGRAVISGGNVRIARDVTLR